MDLTFMGPRPGGMGRYVLELLPALLETDPELSITAFVGNRATRDLRTGVPDERVRWVRLPLRPSGCWRHRVSQRVVQPIIARASRLDVFHNPATLGPVGMAAVPTVVTLLDCIWLDHPESVSPDPRVASRTARALARNAVRADRVITYADRMVEALTGRLGVDERRIDRVPLGASAPPSDARPTPEAELRRRFALEDRPVVLCVSQRLVHKNLELLIRVVPALSDTRAVLVLPGNANPYENRLRDLADALGVTDDVRLPEWLSTADLEGFYRLARCVALPSRMEGFGLPVLEAMARDVPVACSNRWALPQVAGDAALLFDPDSVPEATRAIRSILEDPIVRKELVARGRRRVADFSWRRCAERTLASYRSAIRDRRGVARR